MIKKNNKIKESWNIILKEYDKLTSNYSDNLSDGLIEGDIKAIASALGFTFPSELAELYKCNNGDTKDSFLGSILGLRFIPLSEVYDEWKVWSEISDEEGLNEFCTSTPEKAIKLLYANKYWIPFASDGGGNHIGIDLDPDINGTVGQVINFGRDDEDKVVLAKSLNDFLKRMIKVIQSEDFKLVEIEGEDPSFYITDEDMHPTDYLKTSPGEVSTTSPGV